MSKYHGYTNFETWLVALHIDSNEFLSEEINDAYNDDRDPYEFEINLQSIIRHYSEIENNFLAADLINAALNDVNWREIATLIIEDK